MSYLADENPIQNYVHHVDTSFTQEVISTTIEYVPGTEVTYTPATGASKVIYECNYQTSWEPDSTSSYINSRLQYSTDGGSSWTTIAGTQLIEGNSSSSIDYNWHQFSYIHILDTWSGERKLRLAVRSWDSSTEFTVGKSYNAIPSAGVGVGSCPHVSIYSVTI